MPPAPEKPPSGISGQFWDGRDLEEVHRRLVMLFEKRHLSPAEDYAQEVLVRMLRKLGRLFSQEPTKKDHKYPFLMRLYEKYTSGCGLDGGEEGCDPDLLKYAYSIARNVRREAGRSFRLEPLPHSVLERGIKIRDAADLHYLNGLVYRAHGNEEEAATEFKRAYDMEPTNSTYVGMMEQLEGMEGDEGNGQQTGQ